MSRRAQASSSGSRSQATRAASTAPGRSPACSARWESRRGRLARGLVEPRPGLLDPLLQLDAHLGEVHAGEEAVLVERQRLVRPALRDRRLEGERIAPETALLEPHLVVRPGLDRSLADRPPQVVQRLAERPAGFLRAQLRPEEREEGVPPVKPPRDARARGRPAGPDAWAASGSAALPAAPFEQLERSKRMETKHIDASLAAVTGTNTRVTRGG